jgi:ABC-2 type transport system ATP-binding protein
LANELLHDPEVLILDEPTTGLDPNQLTEIRNLITSIGKEKTIFISTHIMQEVEAICDRVIIINKGEIVADTTLAKLQKDQLQVIEVEFDYRIEDVLMKQIPHVKQIVNTHGLVYEITFDTTKDKRSTVFDFAHDNSLKAIQINPKNKNLESLFRELTIE